MTKTERTLVSDLIRHLSREGFTLNRVWDGEAWNRAADCMLVLENVDDAALSFVGRSKSREHCVQLSMGNGKDIVTDWSIETDPALDHDGWNLAMDRFGVELRG